MGVKVIVAVMLWVVLLAAVKLSILPCPLDERPMLVLSLIQTLLVPETEAPGKFILSIVSPAQTTIFSGLVIVGVGFIVIWKFLASPWQFPPKGITIKSTIIGSLELFFAVKAGILPVPLEARPISVLLFFW